MSRFRAYFMQCFLHFPSVTEADSVSVLQLCHMCVGAYGMLVSSVYEQTICSYIRINMWMKGVRTYVGTLMVYVSMMILAFLALITIFIYAGIFEVRCLNTYIISLFDFVTLKRTIFRHRIFSTSTFSNLKFSEFDDQC